MKLVLYPPVDELRLALIEDAAGTMRVVNADDDAAALDAIRDADAVFGKLTPELLAAAENLKWVQSPTASLEHYLFPELIEHPCKLSNMRGLFSDVIADHVLGYMLCFARNLHLYRDRQMQSRWSPVGGEDERSTFAAGPAFVSGIDRRHRRLADCTLLVVGVGAIGAEICRRAHAFGTTILGVDPLVRKVAGVGPVQPVEQLDELLPEADFVAIAAPHTPETEKLFNRERIRRMQRDAVLINVGRGVIVDLADLTASLEAGEIAGAALDVFETEPLPADHPLWRMENVIITPHIAAATPRIAERHLETLLENVRRFAAGEQPLNLVDKRRWF